ncbi:ATP-dependent zinc metalloprotease FtsH [Conexibacter sp. CPCC 206217]|uniref:ATP-dependent zinc metalloprotease FtsH n=1 Tax=Conexibacter sp. CPCC 206217 TaxID=3064574 RepID=UPI0027282FBC|nr:ATP-dependent zinc metalloprotease FtsH [Conexibacter sp. CPCC 206217]MDO8212962.1 ATP-dependent zinc metalloprotease FtsH [Conexibacter sp. CPCC 206217]
MTDDPQAPQPDPNSDERPLGTKRATRADALPRARVRSGLAERRNPAADALRNGATAIRRFLLRDVFALGLMIAALVIVILFFTLLGATKPSSSGVGIPLSQVFTLARERVIVEATLLDQDARVQIHTRDGSEFWAAYPSSGAQTATLSSALDRGGAIVAVKQQPGKAQVTIVVQFLLPILLLVCLFALFMRIGQDGGAGGIASFSNFTGRGKKKGKGTAHKVTFADIAGVPEAVAELAEIRDYLADPSRYLDLGAAAPKGVLLVGPPGTGKTLLAKAVAGEAEAAFFSLSGSDFVESLVGVGAARVRDLFAKARRMSPAIIFIDEFDAAGRKRGAGIGQGNDEREQTLNQLLVEMDGFGGDGGLVVMGATNRPDILDPALLRPGRFDRQITVDTPDVHGRGEILRLHGNKRPMGPDTDLDEIARLTPGFSGAELANVVNEAALLTVRAGEREITQKVLEESIDRVVSGPAKKHLLTERERWIISIHEASHAVVTEAMGTGATARKVSIVARGRTLGTAAHMLTDRDQTIMEEQDLIMQLIAILAGAAGERIEFGGLSTGVHDDLHEATAIARSMVTSFGMSEELGPVTIGEKAGEVFLGASLQELGSVGPRTLDVIDEAVERLVKDSELVARGILRQSIDAVHETAQALLVHETLSGVALEAVLSTVPNVEPEDFPRLREQERGSMPDRDRR